MIIFVLAHRERARKILLESNTRCSFALFFLCVWYIRFKFQQIFHSAVFKQRHGALKSWSLILTNMYESYFSEERGHERCQISSSMRGKWIYGDRIWNTFKYEKCCCDDEWNEVLYSRTYVNEREREGGRKRREVLSWGMSKIEFV